MRAKLNFNLSTSLFEGTISAFLPIKKPNKWH